jgi:predicted ATPase/DNA-binding SARP family transcriptional activator
MPHALHAAPVSPLRLSLLGSFRLERATDGLIRLPTRKIESLLAFLVLHPEPHSREKLAALLWGEVSDGQARGSLRKALTLVRAALGNDIILADRQGVQLNPDFDLVCDTREFEHLLEIREFTTLDAMNTFSQQLETLYRGELLADLYDDWIFSLREEYHTRFVNALLTLTQGYRSQSEYARAIELARRVLDVDPANERAHQHIMFCYVGLGDRYAALKQYEECIAALEQELAVEPSPETQALAQWIQQFSGERPASEALATNLPIPVSSFIGRQRETTALKHFLTSNARLVTLTGPGGSGKTRLAVQTAMDLVDTFPDGVWWVELASLSDSVHVTNQVAKTLGVHETSQEPLVQSLNLFLQSRSLLLILDNCEHVLETSAQLAHELLSHSPQVKIMATSREALRIAGEQVYPVPTLNVPRHDALSYPDLLREFEGIRLFVERAQAIQPTFRLTEQNAYAVAQICARLDGIPLALELAASRANILSPHEIAARLDARFDLLKDANRAAPLRHQTLRAVLDWSCELLSTDERILFRRMSVFAGGCTLDALQKVIGDVDANSILGTLTHLVDKSLVVTTSQGTTTRYGMLETIRAYARDMLDNSEDSNIVRARHLTWFVQLAEYAQVQLRGRTQEQWLARLDAELDNLRAALDWAIAHDVEQGFHLGGALEWFWGLRGHWSEGAVWLAHLLAAAKERTAGRARALVAASNLKYWGEQEYAAAHILLAESIEIYRALGQEDTWNLGYALALDGGALSNLEDNDAARAALQESLDLSEPLGEAGKWIGAWALLFLAWVEQDIALRSSHLKTSVTYFRELQDLAQLQVALAHLAWCYLSQKNFAGAEAAAQEAFTLTQQIGDTLGMAWIQKLFGDCASAQGDYLRAAALYQTAFEQFERLGNQSGMRDAQNSLERVQSKLAV